MARRNEFADFVREQMSFVNGLRLRSMFGGYGVYQDDRIFAIIVDDRLYFKADNETRVEFEAKGLAPFTYTSRGKTVAMQYFEAPVEVFEETDAMRIWVAKAFRAAAPAGKPVRRRTPRKTKR